VCCELFCACVCAAVGDTVTEDEVVCEIETDKVVSAAVVYILSIYLTHHTAQFTMHQLFW